MKNLFILLTTTFLFSCSAEPETHFVLRNNKVSLKIGSNITRQELANIAKKIKTRKNIDVDITGSEFEDGRIRYLSLKVNCNDGFSGKLQVSGVLLDIFNYGFLRDYHPDAEDPFSIGKM